MNWKYTSPDRTAVYRRADNGTAESMSVDSPMFLALVTSGVTPDDPDPLPKPGPDLQDSTLAQLDIDITAAVNLADAKAALRKFAQAFRQARKS